MDNCIFDSLFCDFFDHFPEYARGDVLWAWVPEAGTDRNVAAAYIIVGCEDASDGQLMLFARFGAEWQANPWTARPVLARMLGRCSGPVYTIGDWRPINLTDKAEQLTWRYVLQVLRSLDDHLLDTPVHISCEPSDTVPDQMRRYQGTPDTITTLMHGHEAVGLVMCYLGSPL